MTMDTKFPEPEVDKIVNNILSSLTLEQSKKPVESESSLRCLKCELNFEFPEKKDEYLAHLYTSHRLVIADVDDIGNLKDYLTHWLEPFRDNELEVYCTTLLLDQLPDGTPSKNEKYYLLSDILPSDYELRKRLHTERLESVLAQHQFERTDREFARECLHCRDVIKGLRADFLEHLFVKHFVQLGRPENLVFIDELIDIVQNKLENLICLFCEKVFKDRGTLKEHMRKKGHKRINPDIKSYDRFFLVNYKNEKAIHVQNFKTQKSHHQIAQQQRPTQIAIVKCENAPVQSTCYNNKKTLKSQSTKDIKTSNFSDDEDCDWSDWAGEKQILTCLYCDDKKSEFHLLKRHMAEEHGVDFKTVLENLNFYQKIKVVNYVRRQMHILRCVTCNQIFADLQQLQLHLKEAEHYGIGEKKQWDKPEFFFPTYEDDGLLYILDNCNDNDSEELPVLVFCEDAKVDINKHAESLSLEKHDL